jgi:transcriptional regulator with XRE-family HTH domain
MASDFGDELRAIRLRARMSMRTFAARMGVSAPYLCEVEHGNRAPLTPARLDRLAKAGIDVSVLRRLADPVAEIQLLRAERDEWKRRALAAEALLDEVDDSLAEELP